MNCCNLEKVGTKEHGKMLKKGTQIFEDGRVPVKEAKNWKIEGQKVRITRKENRRLLNEFEMGGFMAQKGPWNLARENAAGEREVLCLRKKVTLSESTRPCMFLQQLAEGGCCRQGRKKTGGRQGN